MQQTTHGRAGSELVPLECFQPDNDGGLKPVALPELVTRPPEVKLKGTGIADEGHAMMLD